MTIYMVEHLFSRPDWEAQWNAWYEGNLKVLLGVPGFLTGQRFRSAGSAPRYMAMYTVDSPDVSSPPQTVPSNAICYRAITAQQGPLWQQ